MTSRINPEYTLKLARARISARRVLLRNDLDPYEFIVEIHPRQSKDGGQTLLLEILTWDRAVSVSAADIPSAHLDDTRSIGHDAIAQVVEQLIPELLERMRSARQAAELSAAQ